MCIINHTHKFVFVHVPKAAGTSVSSWLSQYSTYRDLEIGGTQFGERIQGAYARRFGLRKHSSAQFIRSIAGDEVWTRYFSFAFVRNPFSRAVSIYQFLCSWTGAGEYGDAVRRFDSFEHWLLSDEWLSSNGPDGILKPQKAWICGADDSDRSLVDYLGRMESIETDIAQIALRIGLPVTNLPFSATPRMNASDGRKKVRWNEAMAERVVTRYRADFERFEYPTIPWS